MNFWRNRKIAFKNVTGEIKNTGKSLRVNMKLIQVSWAHPASYPLGIKGSFLGV
jgi:hypothetical protein